MGVKKLSGRASYISYNGAKIAIKKYSGAGSRKMADSTDGDNYDAATDIVHTSQIPVSSTMKLDVEGLYDLNGSTQNFATDCFGATDPRDVVLGLDAGNVFGHGKFDLSDFSIDSVIDDVVSFKCSLMSNGKFTPGS